MTSTDHITADPGLLLAVERNCNGANAHKLREYAHLYVLTCFLGDERRTNRARRQLEGELIKAEYARAQNAQGFNALAGSVPAA